ncbi:MAG: 3-deoxy-7-phosphoheptulonate synthase [Elusimicrobiota bacterium]
MIITLKPSITKKQLNHIVQKIKDLGFAPHMSKGKMSTIVGVIGENAILTREMFDAMPGIEFVTAISKPYKLASREFKKEDTIVEVSGVKFGGKKVVVIAGPCSVEDRARLLRIAKIVKDAGAQCLRGGAFKPRTSPYSFQGLGELGLKYLREANKITGLPVVTELMSVDQIPLLINYADVLQIGARNIQNFDLLKEAGKTKMPVMLKRGMSTTVKEFLMSAEYVLSQGNYKVILCERGIRTFEDSTRFTLDLNAVPVLKTLSHLPVIVDPSHGVGIRKYVTPMARAAVAAGADGLMIEVHNDPEKALSDGPQSLLPSDFEQMMIEVKAIARAIGRDA